MCCHTSVLQAILAVTLLFLFCKSFLLSHFCFASYSCCHTSVLQVILVFYFYWYWWCYFTPFKPLILQLYWQNIQHTCTHMYYSLCSWVVSVTPLDVVKIRLQAQKKPNAFGSGKCFLYCNGLMDHMCTCLNAPSSAQTWYKKRLPIQQFSGTMVSPKSKTKSKNLNWTSNYTNSNTVILGWQSKVKDSVSHDKSF